MKPNTWEVRSLSPAYWYVCDVEMAAFKKDRGQVSPAFASRAEAERFIARRFA